MTSSNGHRFVSQLPAGWAKCSLADAIIPGRPRGNPANFVGQPFIGLEHIEAHTTRMLGFVSAETMRSSGVQFSAGDVLYGRMRPYLNKVWLADRDGLCSGEFIVFPKTGALRGGFLKYRLNAQDFVAFTDHATTGDRPRADFADFGKFPVLVPPLTEQSRIADRIDELFTDLTAGVAALERVKRSLSRYRAAVLHAAVTGRLTEAWRKQHGKSQEPGPKLLERILVERRRLWEQRTLAKYERDGKQPPKNWRDRYPEPSPPKPPADGVPLPQLPEEWCWASVDQLLREPLRNGHSAKQADSGVGVRTLTLTAVTYGAFTEANIKQTVADPQHVEELWLEPDDLLIERANTRELVGTTRRFPGPSRYAVFPDLVIRARVVQSIRTEFVEHALRSPSVHRYFQKAAQGTAGSMPKIDQPTIESAAVPLPPVAEQAAIVEAVTEKLSQIDNLETEVEHGLARASRLRQAILKAAFEGRLVPQDPNDEPASVLLERIRAEAVSVVDVPARTRRKKPSRKAAAR